MFSIKIQKSENKLKYIVPILFKNKLSLVLVDNNVEFYIYHYFCLGELTEKGVKF